MKKTKRPVGRPRTTDLKGFTVKLPARLVAQLEKAASDSWDSRNMVIRRVLEQYFSGELCRHDFYPFGLLEQCQLRCTGDPPRSSARPAKMKGSKNGNSRNECRRTPGNKNRLWHCKTRGQRRQ